MEAPERVTENPQIETPVLAPTTKTVSSTFWDLGLKRAPSRSIPLDFLRGVAILMVLFHHSVVFTEEAGIWRYFLILCSRVGWLGVDLFFVLSGFLIGGLLFKEIQGSGTLDVKRFLIRRGLKIWPAYFIFLAAGSILAYFDPFKRHQDMSLLKWNLLHLQNYLGTPFGPTWSLAVEEHFYLALPLLLLLILKFEESPRQRLRLFPVACFQVAVVCLVLRCNIAPTPQYDPLQRSFPTHLRADSLMFGTWLAYVFHYHRASFNALAKRGWLMGLLAALLISPAILIFRLERPIYTVGFTSFYLGFGALLLACVGSQESSSALRERFWNAGIPRLVAAVGFYSYGIYLWHNDFVRHFWRWFWRLPGIPPLPSPLYYPVVNTLYLVTAIALGIGMTKLIEIPFLIWRDRLFPPKDGR